MKTYAESCGENPFDWNEWLDNAIKETPSRYEKRKARSLSRRWVTCACGNQCDAIPRDEVLGIPKDVELEHMGIEFMDHIVAGEWTSAKEVLGQIEARSAYLLAQ